MIFAPSAPKAGNSPQNSTIVGTKSYSNLLFQAGVIGKIGDNERYAALGYDVLKDYPMSFLRAGYHYTTGISIYPREGRGYYWSRSSYSDTNAYFLNFANTLVLPRYNNVKTYGCTIRCVAL